MVFLAVAALQLQAAHVGANLAELSNDGEHTLTLQLVATDYGGVSQASLNLAVRCSATAIDLCAAAVARLCVGRSRPGLSSTTRASCSVLLWPPETRLSEAHLPHSSPA